MRSFFRRIFLDDDGVALAFGITFFLLVFLFGMAVYAVGETVRQRIELQNAADAAAYSAATVQADTLSRVACINKAMSWTYVMMNRKLMDYVTDKWLEKVEKEWDKDLRSVRENWNWQSTCGTRREGSDYWVGTGGRHKQVLLNRSQTVSIDTIKAQRQSAAAQGKSYKSLSKQIDNDRKTLAAMDRAERYLFSELQTRMNNTVKKAILENISETPNDQRAGGADINYKFISQSPDSYIETMRNTSALEQIFLVFGGFKPDPKEISKRGVDKWWELIPPGQEGFSREYRQKANHLIAEWQWFGIRYVNTGNSCVPFIKGVFPNSVRGQDVYDGYFRCGQPALARRLRPEFFGRRGVLVVGLKRKYNNPFSFMFQSGAPEGLFSAFSLKDNRYLWTASAARAGYASPIQSQRRPGLYEITFMDVAVKDTWNLCEADWDATLIPVKLAYDDGRNRQFNRAGEVLPVVYGGLSPGTLAPPPLPGSAPSGGAFDLGGARNALFH